MNSYLIWRNSQRLNPQTATHETRFGQAWFRTAVYRGLASRFGPEGMQATVGGSTPARPGIKEVEKWRAPLPDGHVVERLPGSSSRKCCACGVRLQRLIYGSERWKPRQTRFGCKACGNKPLCRSGSCAYNYPLSSRASAP